MQKHPLHFATDATALIVSIYVYTYLFYWKIILYFLFTFEVKCDKELRSQSIYFNYKCFLYIDNAKQYNCNRCGRKYKYQGTLSRHIRYECGTIFKFSCSNCTKQFRRKDILKLHLATVHKIVL